MEWLIILSILALLVSLPIVFTSIIFLKEERSLRFSEAEAFLSSIAAKQEQYRSRHGTYVSTGLNPITEPGATQRMPWDNDVHGWKTLGARPRDTHVAFQYQTRSGEAADPCVPPEDIPTACDAQMRGRTWFWAVARNEAFFVIYNSERPQPWVLER